MGTIEEADLFGWEYERVQSGEFFWPRFTYVWMLKHMPLVAESFPGPKDDSWYFCHAYDELFAYPRNKEPGKDFGYVVDENRWYTTTEQYIMPNMTNKI